MMEQYLKVVETRLGVQLRRLVERKRLSLGMDCAQDGQEKTPYCS